MGLDVYVMPYRLFQRREFRTPAEALFGDAGDVVTEGVPADFFCGRFEAWRRHRALLRAVRAANGKIRTWPDSGEPVYARQCHDPGMSALRTLARWMYLGGTAEGLRMPPSRDWFAHPVWEAPDNDATKASHLLAGRCALDYVLPSMFARVVAVEPYRAVTADGGRKPMRRTVCSAPMIRDELAQLAPAVEALPEKDFPRVHEDYAQYREVIELSVKKRLPVIFWG